MQQTSCHINFFFSVFFSSRHFSATTGKEVSASFPTTVITTDREGVKYYNNERDRYDDMSYYDLEEDMKKLRLPQPSPYSS